MIQTVIFFLKSHTLAASLAKFYIQLIGRLKKILNSMINAIHILLSIVSINYRAKEAIFKRGTEFIKLLEVFFFLYLLK